MTTPQKRTGKKPCNMKPSAEGKIRVAKNDPKWYGKAGVPAIGANFAVLQDVEPAQYVLPNGMRLDSVQVHYMSVNMPVDEHQSFMQMLQTFYADIREKNSGAANYDWMDLGALFMNIRSAKAVAANLLKMCAAVRTTKAGAVDSAAVCAVAAGENFYNIAVENIAQLENELQVRIADLESISVPPMAIFDRDDYVFRAVHLDSESAKPSMMSFFPSKVFTYAVTGTAPARSITATAVAGTGNCVIQVELDRLEQILNAIFTNPINSLIRGDIRNAFGDEAIDHKLSQRFKQGLLISVNDKEIMSQDENAAILGIGDNLSIGAAQFDHSLSEATGNVTLDVQFGGATDPGNVSRAQFDERLINWHGAKKATDEELLAIIQFDCYAARRNSTLRSYWEVIAGGSIIWLDTAYITGINPNGSTASTLRYGNLNGPAVGGNAGNIRQLAFFNKIMEHSPMYIVAPNDPYGYFWNLDNFGVIDSEDLETYHVWATKSLYQAPRPRGEFGRIVTRA